MPASEMGGSPRGPGGCVSPRARPSDTNGRSVTRLTPRAPRGARRARDVLRERLAEALHFVPFERAPDRGDDVKPLAPRRLREALEPERAKPRADVASRLHDAGPAHAVVGIEIEHEDVGLLDAV